MKNKQALYKIGYGLYVLSSRTGEKDNACIVNAVMQVTSSPMRVALAVNKENLTHDMIRDSGVFTLSMLTEETPFDLIRHFGFQSGRQADKFDGTFPAQRGENGVMHLDQFVNAWLSCRVVSTTDLGTHTLFLADVEDGDVLSDQPSLTFAYYQAHIKPKAKPERKTGWRCTVCGYIYEGETLPSDFTCPLCKHGAEDFEKIE